MGYVGGSPGGRVSGIIIVFCVVVIRFFGMITICRYDVTGDVCAEYY